MKKSFQDYYPDNFAVCYGCGRLNDHGLHIKSYWKDDIAVCHFQPKPYHTAVQGYTYGGLLASLIDCHATGTAAAAMYRHENRPQDSEPAIRFVTGNLNVRYVSPTPIDQEIKLRAQAIEIRGRKVTVKVEIFSGNKITATGEVIVFRVADDFLKD